MFLRNRFAIVMLATIIASLLISGSAMAYVGPGSGLEFVGYGLGLIIMLGAAFLSAIMWPVYAVLRKLRGSKPQSNSGQPATATATVGCNPTTPPAHISVNGQSTPSVESIS